MAPRHTSFLPASPAKYLEIVKPEAFKRLIVPSPLKARVPQ